MDPIALTYRRSARTAPRRRLLATGFAAALLLAACGDDDDADSTDAATTDAPSTDAPSTDAPSTDAATTDAASTEAASTEAPPSDTTGTSEAGATTAPGAGGAIVGTAETDIGEVLVDAQGFTLYGFLNDAEGESTCVDACADAWPPVLVDGEPDVGELDASVFSVVDHPQGSMLKAGDFPLYTFAGDEAPGDVNGQGSGGVWFAMAPDGTMIST